MIQRERVDDFLVPASYSQHTYPYSLLWLNIHAYRNKQDAETRSCFSSRNNRSSPICHLFTPGWMWVEMLEVKSGACQCLFSIQKLNPPSLLSSAEGGQCHWLSLWLLPDWAFKYIYILLSVGALWKKKVTSKRTENFIMVLVTYFSNSRNVYFNSLMIGSYE